MARAIDLQRQGDIAARQELVLENGKFGDDTVFHCNDISGTSDAFFGAKFAFQLAEFILSLAKDIHEEGAPRMKIAIRLGHFGVKQRERA